MLRKIIGFELRYRFSKPMTYIFIGMMIFQAIWYVKGTYDYYVNDAMLYNSAGMVYQAMAGGGMLMMIVIAIITGTALFKDIEFKTAETLYSYPVKDKTWILGKFIAAYLVNLIIVVGYAIGFTIVQYTGMAPSSQFGAVPWGHIAYGFLIFSIPNMFIYTMISLSMVVFHKKMASGYLGVFLIMMLFMMTEGSRENAQNITLNYLFDPTGYCLTKDAVDLLPVALKNTAYFHLSGIFWVNRIFWIAVTSIVTFFAFRKFNFKYFLAKPSKKRNAFVVNELPPLASKLKLSAHKVFGTNENIKKLFRLSRMEFLNTVRPIGFKIIAALLAMMFFGYNYLWNAEYYIHTDTLPITSMMTYTRLPNGVYILILLAIFAGELLFKEKSSNVWQITDALPVPTWVTYFSKYIAMIGISVIFVLLLLIPGVVAQLLQGFTNIEWGLYCKDLFSYHFGLINYLYAVSLAFFLGAVAANRFTGHILSVFVIFFIIVFADMGVIEQVRFMFPFTPGIDDYSEMNGYGVFGTAAVWFNILWGFLSAAFLLLGLWFWNRGSMKPTKKRFAINKPQLGYIGKIAAVVFLCCFFYMQHYVQANDHDLGNFKTDNQQEAEDAAYEKQFKYIENQNHPYVCGLDVTIDLVPDERRADYTFKMQLTNRNRADIDTLHLNLKDFVTLNALEIDGKSFSPAWSDDYGQMAYVLPYSLKQDDTVAFKGYCSFQYQGFCTNNPQRALVYNGSFLEEDIIPHIGYNDERELDENRIRNLYGLEKLHSRMEPVDNIDALRKDALSPQALHHKTTLRIHTTEGQTAYASGAFKGMETITGKQYAVYKTEVKAAMKWIVGSARYTALNAELQNGTKLNILYDARHAYNLEHIQIAVDNGISFLVKYLGMYPYTQLTISEIPFYNDEDFYVSPNLIAISEKHCWTADGKREKDLSYIYYTICREIVTQWVQQNMHVADVEGSDMLLKAIPEAYALWYVKEKFGDDVLKVYIDKKIDRYNKDRSNEPNIEPPLIYADGVDYLEENKGAVELLNVIGEIGIVKFSELLKTCNSKNNENKYVFKDFYDLLFVAYPDDKNERLRQAFEKVL